MRTRTPTFIARFTNDAEGICNYKQAISEIRKHTSGGRFIKMFRYGKRNPGYFVQSGSTLKNGASHFDAYLICRDGKAPVRR